MKIDHIQLAMPEGSEDQARAFFCEALGMDEEQKPPPLSERGGCWFRKGSALIHVGVDPAFIPQRKAHPALIVAGLDALAEKLESLGHQVTWDNALANRQRFYTEDPFGNRIELMRDGDGFSQE